MIASRRSGWNFSLQQAAAHAADLGKPLLVLEALRCDYPWASDRLHRFVIEGMEENARRFAKRAVRYYPYVEPRSGAGRGLLEALAARACLVVTDDYPAFFLPGAVRAAARRVDVRMERIDSNGLYPMHEAERVYASAYAFRRHLQRTLRPHLEALPEADPLERLELPRLACLPRDIERRWPIGLHDPAGLQVDHTVPPCQMRGGTASGERALAVFLESRLARYARARNQPEDDVGSGLSAYLHFGHISAHQVFVGLAAQERWRPSKIAEGASGRRTGWWGMSDAAEAFLDQLVTWRELAYNFAVLRDDYDRYDALPDWCRSTLDAHRSDRREPLYELETFEHARTQDPLWNAAQNQLLREGRIHGYLRMLWGKKILEWSATPERAVDIMIELNNKYALDGRDPNSYAGIFWVLGRYDRPWGPERPVFGKIRYMSSANTARKLRLRAYLDRYS